MCTYLKNMGGYKHNQLKGRSYKEFQKFFDKAYKQVNSFILMDSEVVKISMTRTEGSSKRTGDELESDKSKKHKIDEHVEAENDDDQEEAEMKKHIEIVKDDEVAIDAIPLTTKPPMILSKIHSSGINKKDAEDPGNESGKLTEGNEDSEVPSIEESRVNQEKDASVNNTNTINTVSPIVNTAGIKDNVVDENIIYGCADDPNMPELEDIYFFK
ncbi:hypothetical protein Tco_1041985 [Tanacetum coccineum]|uniref:Uncharacterized protein n=1 Tax=Tanacetum coccineum TaxID=301880 RepID=A0ABQ5GHR4_9ASTR